MRTTLLRIPHEAFGLPVFGVGLVLAAWIAFSLGLMIWLLRRKGWTNETISYLPVLIIVGLAFAFVVPLLEEKQEGSDVVLGLPIRGYGFMVLCGVVAAVGVTIARGRRLGLKPDLILSLAFWVFIGGIVCARLFFVIQNWEDFRRDDLWEWIKGFVNVTEGGLVVYGAFIGALLAGVLFVRRRGLKLLAMADLAAPGLVLGLALGRIGCLLNGCCYGGVCEVDKPFHSVAITFPREHDLAKSEKLPIPDRDFSPPYADQKKKGQLRGFPDRSLPVYPTQIFSAVNAGLLFLVLWFFYPLRRRDGEVFALLLTLYPIGRFLLECIRDDVPGLFGTPLTISQWISVGGFAAAIGLWLFLFRQPKQTAFPKAA